jgi:hypothetical protein
MDSSNPTSDEIAFVNAGITLVSLTSEAGTVIDNTFTNTEWSTVDLAAYKGQKAFVTYTVKATTKTIVISGDSFPGTYYVVGDTYARSEITGEDEFFQFIIPKAKMQSEVTLTMEAEGDPSTFNMSLKVLRPAAGDMMRLVKYSI